MQSKITPKTVAQLRPGQIISDTEIRGFSARCWPSGVISFDLRYRTPTGERRRLSLGQHGTLTADEARKLAKKRAGEVADDRDPVAKRKVATAKATNTVNSILDGYVDRVLAGKRSRAIQVSAFDRLVRPQIGTLSIYALTRADMAKLFDTIEDTSGPVMSDRLLAYLRKAFNWQQSRDQNFLSPIVKGMARTSSKERARSRTLTDDELRAIWTATAGEGAFDRLVRFLLLTAARRTEASAMTWSEIAGADWTLPAARNKTKVDLVRPLSKAAVTLLRKRRGEYVFSSDAGVTCFSGFSKGKAKLDRESGVTGWTPHDLRRTARTLMSRAGVDADHAERCLGHAIVGVRGTYDRHAYRAEKAAVFEKLADLVDQIVRGRVN